MLKKKISLNPPFKISTQKSKRDNDKEPHLNKRPRVDNNLQILQNNLEKKLPDEGSDRALTQPRQPLNNSTELITPASNSSEASGSVEETHSVIDLTESPKGDPSYTLDFSDFTNLSMLDELIDGVDTPKAPITAPLDELAPIISNSKSRITAERENASEQLSQLILNGNSRALELFETLCKSENQNEANVASHVLHLLYQTEKRWLIQVLNNKTDKSRKIANNLFLFKKNSPQNILRNIKTLIADVSSQHNSMFPIVVHTFVEAIKEININLKAALSSLGPLNEGINYYFTEAVVKEVLLFEPEKIIELMSDWKNSKELNQRKLYASLIRTCAALTVDYNFTIIPDQLSSVENEIHTDKKAYQMRYEESLDSKEIIDQRFLDSIAYDSYDRFKIAGVIAFEIQELDDLTLKQERFNHFKHQIESKYRDIFGFLLFKLARWEKGAELFAKDSLCKLAHSEIETQRYSAILALALLLHYNEPMGTKILNDLLHSEDCNARHTAEEAIKLKHKNRLLLHIMP